MSGLLQFAQMRRDHVKAYNRIDVVIGKAGVFKTSLPRWGDGMDVRFAVTTFTHALLSGLLLPIAPENGCLVHLSSAAQSYRDGALLQQPEIRCPL